MMPREGQHVRPRPKANLRRGLSKQTSLAVTGSSAAQCKEENMPRQIVNMRRFVLVAIIATLAIASVGREPSAQAQTGRHVPVLAVDPYWPQLPEDWILGVGAG